MDLLVKCQYDKYFRYDGYRCFARLVWHTIHCFNHFLCCGVGNYLRNLVCVRDDFVYIQHYIFQREAFYWVATIGHFRIWHRGRRHDCDNYVLGLFLLGCAVYSLDCYSGPGLIVVWSE